MKRWYQRNKVFIFTILFSFIGLTLSSNVLMYLIFSKADLVNHYFSTGEVSRELFVIIIPTLLTIVFFFVLVIGFIILILRTIFPKSNAFNILSMKSDRDFLINLPNRIRREMDKNE